jgi:hypothetical protein
MIGSICRSPGEWLSHPQGALLAKTPLIEIEKIGESDPELPTLKDKKRPPLRAFGWDGPWGQRGGFDMDANCSSGYTVVEGSEDQPRLPPTVILNDYLAGYLTAMGVIAALILRTKHGGSYHVRAALARYSMWYSELGIFDPNHVADAILKPDHQVIPPKGLTLETSLGTNVRLEPGITYSETPSFWEVPGRPVLTPRGASEAEWLDY